MICEKIVNVKIQLEHSYRKLTLFGKYSQLFGDKSFIIRVSQQTRRRGGSRQLKRYQAEFKIGNNKRLHSWALGFRIGTAKCRTYRLSPTNEGVYVLKEGL